MYSLKNYNDVVDIKSNKNNKIDLDIELLEKICLCETPSGYEQEIQDLVYDLVESLEDTRIDIESDESGNILITKGKAEVYPTIVAHMDTVHDKAKGEKIVINTGHVLIGMDKISGDLVGVGGDDYCGVYTCLHLLQILDVCKIALFVSEEVG